MAHPAVVAYKRWSETEVFVTVLNFSGETVRWNGLDKAGVKVEKWVAGNYDETGLAERGGVGREGDGDGNGDGEVEMELRSWEGLLGVVGM